MKLIVRLTILSVLMALIGCQRYKRANEFEKYIVERAESIAHAEYTEEVRDAYIKSIMDRPDAVDLWLEDIKERKVKYRKNLHKSCRYIYTFDSIQGREVPFSEIYDSLIALEDTAAIITDDIQLRRYIIAYNAAVRVTFHCEESKRYLEGKSK